MLECQAMIKDQHPKNVEYMNKVTKTGQSEIVIVQSLKSMHTA